MAKVLISVVSLFAYFLLISSDSEPQREEILFEKVDKNLDGYLTKAELDSVFLLFDINHNKVVDKAEFDNDWTTAYQIGTQKEADLLFDHADANDDGIIDHQDLPFIFHFFDVNSDGKVSIDEFLTQWGSLTLMASGTNHTNTTPPPRHTTTMV